MSLSPEQMQRLKEINDKIQNELDHENVSYLIGCLLRVFDEKERLAQQGATLTTA